MRAANVTANAAAKLAACHNFQNGQIRLESMTLCSTVVAIPTEK